MERNQSTEKSISRRGAVKALGAAGAGISGVFGSTQPVLACSTYNGCSRVSDNTTYDAYTGHTTHLGSSLERVTVSSPGDYWTHDFKMAGDGCATENGSATGEVMSQNMTITNNDTTYLSVWTSRNERETGMMPKSNNGSGAANEVVSGVTGVLSAAATAVGSTAGGIALSAATIAESLLNYFASYEESSGRYDFSGSYNGLDKGGHHLHFKVDEHDDGDPYATNNIEVRSEFGVAINGWDVAFGDRGVTMSGSSTTSTSSGTTTESASWRHPEKMNRDELDFFEVKKVKKSSLPESAREALDTSSDYAYIAENPPVKTTPITEARKDEVRDP